jgi:uncharacterized repeat protein (TIGR01451 family)
VSKKFKTRRRQGVRRWKLFGTTVLALVAFAVVFAAASGADLSGVSARHAATRPAHAASHVRPTSAKRFLTTTIGPIGTAAGFEDNDGNLVVDNGAGSTDWNSFSPTWTGTAPYQTGTATTNGFTFLGITDAVVSTTDTAYSGGVKQNDACAATSPSKSPNKDDLARAYIAFKIVGGHTYLELAWVRIPQNTTSADAHVAFEFNQSKTACTNGDGLVQRTTGDLLVLYDFQSGSATISLDTWLGSAWSAPVSLTAAGTAEAAVNTGDVSDTVAPSPETLGTLEFGEAGIDLTAAIGNLSGGGKKCEQFGNVFALSRSSGSSDSAQMEDIVGPAPLTISNCASPTIATTLSATSALPGTTVHDSSALTGATGTAGGTVTYSVYTDSACSAGKQDAGTKTVVNGVVPDSNGIQFNSPGDFYWQAVYSGDDNNNGAKSACTDEHLVIAKNSPTIATTLSESTGKIGDTVHDSSTLTGATATAGGSVTYTVYTNNTCTTGAQSAGVKTVTNHLVPDSNGVQLNSAGDFYWQAVYSGDAANNGATSTCTDEHLVIAKNSPSIATTLSESTGKIGDTVHDSSALTGATATAGGSVTYTVYTNNTCSTGAQDAGTKTVTNHLVPDSNGIQFNSASTFYWQAVYTGDANNNGATSACLSEQLVIGKNSPSIATTLSASTGAIGATVHDSSALTGATATAGGSVTYTVYTNSSCSTGAQSAGVKTVTGGVVPDSNGIQFNSAGDFYWQAVYSGDANNNGATSACLSEHLVIGKNSPSIATTLSDTDVAIGTSVHDSSALSGATSDAGGTVTYTVYSNSTCTANPQPAGTKTVTAGVVPNSDGVQFNAAGDFYWQAVYSGDANNGAATSACNVEDSEHLVVEKNRPSIATDLSATEVVVGTFVHDSATLTGATSGAAGTATYTVYTNNTCTAGAQDAGTVSVSGSDVDNSHDVQFNAAGDFYWQVVYSGDANNNGATSACNSESNEHLLVDKPAISITKNPKSQAIDSGGTATFTITVTNTGTTALTGVVVTDAQAPGCAKAIGTLTAGQSSTYTCSLATVTASFTNSATATGHPPVGPDVTATDTAPVTVNAIPPPPPPPPPAPPAPKIDLSITKTGSPNPATVGNQITWTEVVTNAGPSPATGVKVADSIPAGTTFVSVTTTLGTCTGGALVSCTIGNMGVGQTATITIVTTANVTGTIPNTATVVGNETETNLANNTASASVVVKGKFVPPAVVCTAVGVAPKTLFVGRKVTLTIRVTQKGKAVKGIRIKIKGSTLNLTTSPSNAKGMVTVKVNPKKAGIVTIVPISHKGCTNPRIGVTGVFTPPVTG